MPSLFEAVTDRVKLIIATNAALDFEAELVLANARRKSALLSEARSLEAEGDAGLAAELRRRAAAIDLERPASTALNAGRSLADPCEPAALPAAPTEQSQQLCDEDEPIHTTDTSEQAEPDFDEEKATGVEEEPVEVVNESKDPQPTTPDADYNTPRDSKPVTNGKKHKRKH